VPVFIDESASGINRPAISWRCIAQISLNSQPTLEYFNWIRTKKRGNMHISRNIEKESPTAFSFEFFPPKDQPAGEPVVQYRF
jgi:hypothetical protein